MTTQPIVVLGAAGEMMSLALQRFTGARTDVPLALYDLDLPRLQALSESLPVTCSYDIVDLFDPQELARVIDGACLVVLGAGPYLRTSAPVLEACLNAGVDYLDFSDDIEPTLAALELDEKVQAAEIACYLGCGASPGLLNVMAADAAADLDTVASIDVCWCTGDEGPRPYGAAVIEHLLHIAAGPCMMWRDGRFVTVESFGSSERIVMGGGLGEVSLYQCAHPESTTLPRKYPEASSIRVLGGLDPAPVNAIARGVAVAVRDKRLSNETAIQFFQDIMQDKTGALAAWKYAGPELVRQARRGESSWRELAHFLAAAVRSHHDPYRGGLLARVRGTVNGDPAEVIVRTERSGPQTFFWQSMGTATGTSIAAFMLLALEQSSSRTGGVYCPEDWVTPSDFYRALKQLGTPDAEIPVKQMINA
jgi:saccharopine dehydrogenase-like NADP-dependent oxidoreductase